MKKPVLILGITAIATFVMGWVAHRVYENSRLTNEQIKSPVSPVTVPETHPLFIDSPSINKDSSLYHQTGFIPAKTDSIVSSVSNKIDSSTLKLKDSALRFVAAKGFADFPVKEIYRKKFSKKLDFSTCSSGSLYRKETLKAVEKGAVFAGRYAFTTISCDSNCYSSSIIDLKNGQVFAGPHSTTGYKYRIDSRLLLINPPKADSTYSDCFDCTPELYVWTGKLFKKIQ